MKPIEKLMRTAPVIPVLVIDDIAKAKPLAEALVKAGYPVLEVTLRTGCALDAIKEMKQVEGAIVGAGTVTNPDELGASIDAGAEFIVSPGLTDKLGMAARAAAKGHTWRADRSHLVPLFRRIREKVTENKKYV